MVKKVQGKLTIDLLDRFPNTPTLTLAKRLCKDNPEVFLSVESARSCIRYYRGQHGDKNRRWIATKKYLKDPGTTNPFGLPDSEADDNDPFILPKRVTRCLVMADLHIPYHDVEAITAAIEYGKKMDINGILINGDGIDHYSLSRFVKDPRLRRFDQEIESVKQFLAVLNKEFGCKIFWKRGNHEMRYDIYMRVKAPELLGVASFEFDNIMGFHEFNCEYITDDRVVKIGKLPVVHGHEFQSKATSQVNPARGLFLKANKSAMVSHSHRASNHTETDIEGKLITTWSTGCLCGLAPDYARINKWTHGVAVVIVDDDGAYSVHNKRIYKGEIW